MFSRREIAAQARCGSVLYRDAESTALATCRSVFSELYHANSTKLACRSEQAVQTNRAPNRRCQRISGRIWLPLVCYSLSGKGGRHIHTPRRVYSCTVTQVAEGSL
jgi:hypothetical protein